MFPASADRAAAGGAGLPDGERPPARRGAGAGPALPPRGDGVGRRSLLVPAFVLGRELRHARLTMEVEDSGGVVLTAYHSYARSQPPSAEPRRAPRAAASHPGSRYRRRRGGSGLPWARGWGARPGFLPGHSAAAA